MSGHAPTASPPPHLPQPAKAGDYLVVNEENVVPVADFSQDWKVLVRRDHEPISGNDHRLGYDRGDRIRPLPFYELLDGGRTGDFTARIFESVRTPIAKRRRDVNVPGSIGFIELLAARAAARRQRSHRPAVIGPVPGEYLVLVRLSRLAMVLTGDLHRRFRDLRTTAEKLHGVELRRRYIVHSPRQLQGRFVGGVHRHGEVQPFELTAYRVDNRPVLVTEIASHHAGQSVDVARSVDIGNVDAVAVGKNQRIVAKGLHLHEIDKYPLCLACEIVVRHGFPLQRATALNGNVFLHFDRSDSRPASRPRILTSRPALEIPRTSK